MCVYLYVYIYIYIYRCVYDYVHMYMHTYARMCAPMYAGLGQELCCVDITRPGFAAAVGWDCGMSALGLLLLGK